MNLSKNISSSSHRNMWIVLDATFEEYKEGITYSAISDPEVMVLHTMWCKINFVYNF